MEVSEAIDRAYDEFAVSLPSGPVDICACCVDETVADQLRRRPLRALTAEHFYQYNGSAKSPCQPPEEMAYFLPRLLDLIAHGGEVHHSLELYLVRLGNTDPAWFSADQRRAIQDVALAHFAQGLENWDEPSATGFVEGDAFEYLLMWHLGTVDIAPLLTWWLEAASTSATLHYVQAAYWNYWANGGRITNAFSISSFDELISTWLNDPDHRRVFAGRLVELSVLGPWPCEMDQHIEYVFDTIAG
jgi:hypothetical protein